eukprot:g3065.t1
MMQSNDSGPRSLGQVAQNSFRIVARCRKEIARAQLWSATMRMIRARGQTVHLRHVRSSYTVGSSFFVEKSFRSHAAPLYLPKIAREDRSTMEKTTHADAVASLHKEERRARHLADRNTKDIVALQADLAEAEAQIQCEKDKEALQEVENELAGIVSKGGDSVLENIEVVNGLKAKIANLEQKTQAHADERYPDALRRLSARCIQRFVRGESNPRTMLSIRAYRQLLQRETPPRLHTRFSEHVSSLLAGRAADSCDLAGRWFFEVLTRDLTSLQWACKKAVQRAKDEHGIEDIIMPHCATMPVPQWRPVPADSGPLRIYDWLYILHVDQAYHAMTSFKVRLLEKLDFEKGRRMDLEEWKVHVVKDFIDWVGEAHNDCATVKRRRQHHQDENHFFQFFKPHDEVCPRCLKLFAAMEFQNASSQR